MTVPSRTYIRSGEYDVLVEPGLDSGHVATAGWLGRDGETWWIAGLGVWDADRGEAIRKAVADADAHREGRR